MSAKHLTEVQFLYTPPKAIFFIEGCYFFMLFVIIVLGGIIMWKVEKGNIYVTRGDMLPLAIDATNTDKSLYTFKAGDILRIKIMEKENVSNVLLQKDFTVEEETIVVNVDLLSEDTRIGELINKPHEYWYEIELNPDTPQTMTIVGYSKEKGAALFVLLPEGGNKNDTSKITN